MSTTLKTMSCNPDGKRGSFDSKSAALLTMSATLKTMSCNPDGKSGSFDGKSTALQTMSATLKAVSFSFILRSLLCDGSEGQEGTLRKSEV